MTAATKICTIIGSDKGGVGKSLVAQLLTLIFRFSEVDLRVVEIDNQRKLTGILGEDKVNLSLSAMPQFERGSRDRHHFESFYNPVYTEWSKGFSLTDLGANVTTSLLDWFTYCDIGELAVEDGIRFRFVACATPDEQAIQSAIESAENAKKAFGSLAEVFIVLNDSSGNLGFAPYENGDAMRGLHQQEQSGAVKVIRLPFCDSLLFEYGRAEKMSPIQITAQADDIAARAGLDEVSKRIHRKKLVKWCVAAQERLEPLLTIEETIPEQPAA
ncbi:hypothetical protein [Roseibium sp. RKSG952]|uniref:hypothetical protein n=1 Tax=Roseibium sp. RKSG952 TaxID=2529384 RepID=UPI0012BBA9D7|nr:hypothetical protein [Roseibium sp. RKSG952]MTH95363.1 hypothetical protein [Roseibium sp. RKSG952]